MRRLWRLWVVFVLLVLSVSTVSAQSDRDVLSFSVGGQTHLVRLPQSRAARSVIIQSAVATIVPIYEKLWNATSGGSMAFSLFIDVDTKSTGENLALSNAQIQPVKLPVPSSPWNGQTEASPTTVCEIDLFDKKTLYATDQRLQFELALDVAKCYLDQYGNPPPTPPDWWFKGLAYWMAVQVFPPTTSIITMLQRDYVNNYNQNVTSEGEEAFYFWEFVLGQGLPAAQKAGFPGSLIEVVNGLKNLSGAATFFTPGLFYAYAQVVAANQLLLQPTETYLAQDKPFLDYPGDVDLDLEPNSIVIETVNLPPLNPGEGISIAAEGLTDNGVIASVAGTLLSDNAPVKICNPPSTLTIVAGRGPEGDVKDASLTIDKVKDCNPTPVATAPATAGLPACVVGKFSIRFPFMESLMAYEGGTWQFTFNSNGNFELVAQNVTMQSKAVTLQLTYDYKGTIALEPDGSTPNRFKITRFSVQIQPGAKVLATSDGQTMDMSGLYMNENQLAAPPVAITCADGGAGNPTVDYYATADDPVILTRIASAGGT